MDIAIWNNTMFLYCLQYTTGILNNNIFSLVKEINKFLFCFGDVWGAYDKWVENLHKRTAWCIILLLISHFRSK